MKSIVFASSNAGKLRELKALLAPLGYELVGQNELGVESAAETASTFVENALLKARHVCRETGRAAIADDSGLEVDALNGAPGLYSARYAERAGRGKGDQANNTYLLEQLQEVHGEQARRARFRTVVVRLRHTDDPSPLIASAAWEGHILDAPDGSEGFGYDPVFCNHDTHQSAASLDAATKNRLSHRGKAVAELLRLLQREA